MVSLIVTQYIDLIKKKIWTLTLQADKFVKCPVSSLQWSMRLLLTRGTVDPYRAEAWLLLVRTLSRHNTTHTWLYVIMKKIDADFPKDLRVLVSFIELTEYLPSPKFWVNSWLLHQTNVNLLPPLFKMIVGGNGRLIICHVHEGGVLIRTSP